MPCTLRGRSPADRQRTHRGRSSAVAEERTAEARRRVALGDQCVKVAGVMAVLQIERKRGLRRSTGGSAHRRPPAPARPRYRGWRADARCVRARRVMACMESGGKAWAVVAEGRRGTRHADRRRSWLDHLAERGVLAADRVNVRHAQQAEGDDQCDPRRTEWTHEIRLPSAQKRIRQPLQRIIIIGCREQNSIFCVRRHRYHRRDFPAIQSWRSFREIPVISVGRSWIPWTKAWGVVKEINQAAGAWKASGRSSS